MFPYSSDYLLTLAFTLGLFALVDIFAYKKRTYYKFFLLSLLYLVSTPSSSFLTGLARY
nr:MAG TPA: hypothetical protein [Caudoviricetes sp.]